jgi:voltage-gated potassium channel
MASKYQFTEDDYRGDEAHLEQQPFRRRLFIIIFGTNTFWGKTFDVVLLILILISVASVMLESVSFVRDSFGDELRIIEWVVTGFFTLEYIARVYTVKKPAKYIFSVFGLIDILSIIPTYLSIFLVGTQSLSILRALRLLRVFRVLKLMRFMKESQMLGRALAQSRHKITVFFFFVLIVVFIMGSIMYLVEGPEHGFKSIPISIYWTIVTLTTVGFGDITPQTTLGQMIASVIMLLGYSIIAIPTGIVGAEIYKEVDQSGGGKMNRTCSDCGTDIHYPDSSYCRKCGNKLVD